MNTIVESHIEIRCPASGNIEKLWYRYIPNTVLFECLGCDNSNGSTTCIRCIADTAEALKKNL